MSASYPLSKNLNYHPEGNKLGITIGDLKVGSIEFVRKTGCLKSECYYPLKWHEELNSWYRCCDNNCQEDHPVPEGVPFPTQINYNIQSLEWIEEKDADLTQAITRIWNTYQLLQLN
ncbi:hypothetical protein [Megavirus chiliensis]|uniref:Uncharacterized protein n=1 Tax=Megavirus chiliensis TaxID=1094892 RepID=G5CQI8_9VIRU|nr:hypothetical protein MegaChil _gp0017 [Megavirus chiliensis]AEQ33149.1 hypothetical protein [Megavirus chiliensis]